MRVVARRSSRNISPLYLKPIIDPGVRINSNNLGNDVIPYSSNATNVSLCVELPNNSCSMCVYAVSYTHLTLPTILRV